MASTAKVYATPAVVATRLDELGLSSHLLEAAIKYALPYALEVTEHDPAGAVGSQMYLKGTRGLRDQLAPLGWKPDHTNNYETTVHPLGSHAIAVTSGNRDTGNPDKAPSTKRDRGPATRGAVDMNVQLSYLDALGEGAAPRGLRPLPVPRWHTWLLLHFIDWTAEEVRYELSLPFEMTSEGYVHEWQHRVILAAIPFNRDPLPHDDADDEDLDIPVIRKAN